MTLAPTAPFHASPPTGTATSSPEPAPLLTPTSTPVARVFSARPMMDVGVTQFVELRRYGNGGISSMKFQPGGKMVALAGGAGIYLYDQQSMELLAHLDGRAGWVSEVDWSPDGHSLAAANGNGTVQVWDIASKEVRLIFEQHEGAVLSVAWSPDGRQLASGGRDNLIHIWDAQTGQVFNTTPGQEHGGECGSCHVVFAVRWSPDGKKLAIHSYNSILIWKIDQKETQHIYNAWWLGDVQWSPDGQFLAVASFDGVWIADTQTWKGELEFALGDVRRIAWSSNGDRLAAALSGHGQPFGTTSAARMILLDRASKSSVQRNIEPFPFGRPAGSMFLISDIDWLASGKIAFATRTSLAFWDGAAQMTLHALSDDFEGSDIALSPNDQQLVTSAGRLLTLFPEGGEWTHLGVNRQIVAWSPDGSKIAFRDPQDLRILDVASQKVLWHLGEGRDEYFSNPLTFAWSPSGDAIALKNAGKVELWALPLDASDSNWVHIQTLPITTTTIETKGIIWSPDGALLAYRTETGLAIVDVASNQLVHSFYFLESHILAWSPDGKYIVNRGGAYQFQLIDTQTWEVNHFQVARETIRCLDWSPDGRYLLFGGVSGRIFIWDVQNRQVVKTLEGHTDSVSSVIWARSGDFIVSASRDGTIRLWGLKDP